MSASLIDRGPVTNRLRRPNTSQPPSHESPIPR